MKPAVVIAWPGNEPLADRLALGLGGDRLDLNYRRFPDGESYVRLLVPVKGRKVLLVASLVNPDEKALPIYFLSRIAREEGAREFGLIAPYLGYMRQDKRFHEGEGVTSAYFAEFVSSFADWLVTIDPHLHRHNNLNEIYRIPTRTLHAAPLIVDWIRNRVSRPLLIGPDVESAQWVEEIARMAGAPFVVLKKDRKGDRDVEVSVPQVETWKGHTPVLVDDIVSTARTMIETLKHLKKAGLNPPVCVAIHGLFSGRAFEDLRDAGAGRVVSTNTIPHSTNEIDVSSLLVEACRDFLKD